MKVLFGAGLAALLITLAAVCPEHVWDRAQAATEFSDEVHAEVNRQISMFVDVMDGERPEIEDVIASE